MTYHQLDRIADSFWIVFALALLGAVLWLWRARAWDFGLRAALSVALCQQLSKTAQKHGGFGFGPHFPSTHFAVALALTVGFWMLGRRWGIGATFALFAYGALMLYQRYHTPLEMAGALFAVPLASLFYWRLRRAPLAAN